MFILGIEQTPENIFRLRRLYVLRSWLIHTLNTVNLYFSAYNDSSFQENIKHLCLNERKLCSIYNGK